MSDPNAARGAEAAHHPDLSLARLLAVWGLLPMALALGACSGSDPMVGGSIVGYSHHIEFPIYNFTVNGAMGSNLDRDGEGGQSCCVSLPRRWRSGLVAHVEVEYDTDQGGPKPPPPRRFEVPIEQYPDGAGMAHIHFYPNGKVRAVVANVYPGHPKYPPTEGVEVDPNAYRNYCIKTPSDPICKNAPKETETP